MLFTFESTTWFIIVNIQDIFSWTTMMNYYFGNKRYMDVVRLFCDMIEKGMIPDEVTMSTVISACAHMRAFDLGKEVHLYLMLHEFDLDVYSGSSLIDMYAKCDSINRSMFYQLQNKNMFCWNSIIDGLVTHNYKKRHTCIISHSQL